MTPRSDPTRRGRLRHGLLTGILVSLAFSPLQAQFTEYPTSGFTGPFGITAGPDGAVWFAENHGMSIGRITLSGSVTEYPTPTTFSYPMGIAAGPDGALWFTEYQVNKIG